MYHVIIFRKSRFGGPRWGREGPLVCVTLRGRARDPGTAPRLPGGSTEQDGAGGGGAWRAAYLGVDVRVLL